MQQPAGHGTGQAAARFQYPQADRRGCNMKIKILRSTVCGFQYPQADRRGCNPVGDMRGSISSHLSVSTSGSKGVQLSLPRSAKSRKIAFSIHKRIEGGATEKYGIRTVQYVVFQYPQADRRGCNSQFRAFLQTLLPHINQI